eukprot:3689102-Pleurochrysis_carterae.AAC.1
MPLTVETLEMQPMRTIYKLQLRMTSVFYIQMSLIRPLHDKALGTYSVGKHIVTRRVHDQMMDPTYQLPQTSYYASIVGRRCAPQKAILGKDQRTYDQA